MVLARICEHASSAFIVASTSSDQFCLASSEFCAKSSRNLSIIKRKFRFALSILIWLTPSAKQSSCL